MNELWAVVDMTDLEFRLHMERRHLIVGFVTIAEHEAIHRRGLPNSLAHRHARPLAAKTKVADTASMDWHTFSLHIKSRHPELQDGIVSLAMHAQSHALIRHALHHWHEVQE
jgi:hypothetical protein